MFALTADKEASNLPFHLTGLKLKLQIYWEILLIYFWYIHLCFCCWNGVYVQESQVCAFICWSSRHQIREHIWVWIHFFQCVISMLHLQKHPYLNYVQSDKLFHCLKKESQYVVSVIFVVHYIRCVQFGADGWRKLFLFLWLSQRNCRTENMGGAAAVGVPFFCVWRLMRCEQCVPAWFILYLLLCWQ